jgi:Rrf2 family protein
MQFNVTTDYAVRILICLADSGRQLCGRELSELMHIPYSYLLTVMARMKEAGLVVAARGSAGGYMLGRDAEDISLWDIISVMEGSSMVSRCLGENFDCDCIEVGRCSVRKVYYRLQNTMEDILKGVSLRQLSDEM